MSIYGHISEAKKAKELPVSLQCELLGVSVSGYWAWARRAPSDRALYDAWLIERIRAIHEASKGRHGSPRVHAMVRRQGIRVGEKRRSAGDARRWPSGAPTGAAARAARRVWMASSRSGISSAASFARTPRIACGPRTSSRPGPGRAGCIWRRCRDLFSRRIGRDPARTSSSRALEMAVKARAGGQGDDSSLRPLQAIHRSDLRSDLSRRWYRPVAW